MRRLLRSQRIGLRSRRQYVLFQLLHACWAVRVVFELVDFAYYFEENVKVEEVHTKCCKKPKIIATVLLAVNLPLKLLGRMSKKNLRSKDVQIEAAHWDRVIVSCGSCFRVFR